MKLNRWIYAIVGFIVMLCAGLIYAWSNINKPLKADVSLSIAPENFAMTFSICMAMFCIGGLIGGMIVKKISAKVNIVIALILFPVGLTIAANSDSYIGLYIGYGVFVGLAAGLVYNAVLSVVTKWFQDKQGLISGLLLMGFGLGGFILGPVFKIISDNLGWRTAFIIIGIAFAIILIISIFFFVVPGEGYVPPTNPKKKERRVMEGALDIGPSKMIRRPSFWLFVVWSILISSSGLALIPFTNDFTQTVSNISAMGLVMIAGIVSIFNGLGRVLFGYIYDTKGNKAAIATDSILFIVAAIILMGAFLSNSLVLTVIGFIGVGLAYGGAPSNSSAFVNTFYGNKNYPLNLPILNLQLLVASFIGPNISQTFLGTSIGFMGVLGIMIVFSAISFVAALLIKRA